MDRLACVNVAALPLQVLLQAHPTWTAAPVVVVADDRPQAPVLHLNGRARRAGVRTGQRYATALALARDLRAGTVSPPQIREAVEAVSERLRHHSPRVEPATDMPGVFWLDAQGLARLYPSLRAWADGVRADLRSAGLWSTVAVGFSRFGVYALAISERAVLVCATVAEERARVDRVPLPRLGLEPEVRERLFALGVATVGDFLRLPSAGIRTRFGAATDAVYRLATGRRWAPLVPVFVEERLEDAVELDAPEHDLTRLTFLVKRLLDGFVATLARRAQAVDAVVVQLMLDDRATRVERVRPASPTLEVAQLLTLVRLRLEGLQLTAGIVTLRVAVDTAAATAEQCRLFAVQARRDADGADRALAKLRAECGDHRVVVARLRDAHLPGARFAWEPLARVSARSEPRVVAARPLVRRIYAKPVPFPGGAIEPNVPASFRIPAGARTSQVQRVCGPYVVSGGWWGGGVHREYFFVQTDRGDLWWLYYDGRRRRFFLQGQVE